ncbi:hypothetical protein [Anaeroselena agilis]|uniref:Uncharacterized protein n=1 Tax=Anaeroselena agilis TaxID=3063788 RepID=A0ABU3NX53_9FIRM|nr:hypothetical protein [Selenomonadales bacterium 4137-cl]
METALTVCSLIMLPLAAIAAYFSFRCFKQTAKSLLELKQAVEQLSARTNFSTPKVLFEKQITISPGRPVSRLDINLAEQPAKK